MNVFMAGLNTAHQIVTISHGNYSLKTLVTAKRACKAALQHELGLTVRSEEMSTRTHWQILHSVCAGVGIAVVTSAAASSGDEALAVEGAGAVGKNCPGPGAVTCAGDMCVGTGKCTEQEVMQRHLRVHRIP
ncbi:unnamed protein product [Sphagnum troendelagicum]